MNERDKKAALIRKQLEEVDARKKKVFRWVKFGVQLWAVRMAFAMFGMVIPFGINMYNEMFPADNSIKYTSSVPDMPWFDIIKSEFKLMTDIRNDGRPVVFRGVPLISPLGLRLFFEKALPVHKIQAKISTQKLFVHYASDRLWSSVYPTRNYEYVSLQEYLSDSFRSRHQFHPYSHLDLLSESIGACCEANGDACSGSFTSPDGLHYMYSTFTPFSAYVSSLVPSLTHLYYSQSTDAQVSLWLSSPGSVAGLHYDMEDNFLLQVSGNKTLLLLPPEAVHCVRPHSSLHPHWRQSQLGAAGTTPEGLYSAMRDPQPTCLNIPSTSSTTTPPPPILEVHLSPGDMVYIPAGFFHTLTAGNDSLSVNSWFSSTMSEAYAALLNAPLPFDASSSSDSAVSVKLTALASLIRRVLSSPSLLLSYDSFVHSLKTRYETLVDEEDHCTSLMELKVCSLRDTQLSDSSRVSLRSANSIVSLLAHSKLNSGVKTLLLGDYIEEIIQVIVPVEELTACFMMSFVNDCL